MRINKQRLGRKLDIEALERRAMLYAVTDLPWPETDLSYSVVPDETVWGYGDASNWNQTFDQLVPEEEWEIVLAKAFQSWANASSLNFHRTQDTGLAFGVPSDAHGDIRLGMTAEGVVSGWATYPVAGLAGDITLNSKSGTFETQTYRESRLFSLLVHEIGHSLGLKHSEFFNTVMGGARDAADGLAPDDIAGIQALYGAREHDTFDRASSNDSSGSATVLALPADGHLRERADLTSFSDQDFYRITVPEGTSSIQFSADARQLSLLAPRIEIYDENNSLVSSSSGEFGTVASVEIDNLVAGSTYTVLVDGATSDEFAIGAYHIDIQSFAIESTNQVLPAPSLPATPSVTEPAASTSPVTPPVPITTPILTPPAENVTLVIPNTTQLSPNDHTPNASVEPSTPPSTPQSSPAAQAPNQQSDNSDATDLGTRIDNESTAHVIAKTDPLATKTPSAPEVPSQVSHQPTIVSPDNQFPNPEAPLAQSNRPVTTIRHEASVNLSSLRRSLLASAVSVPATTGFAPSAPQEQRQEQTQATQLPRIAAATERPIVKSVPQSNLPPAVSIRNTDSPAPVGAGAVPTPVLKQPVVIEPVITQDAPSFPATTLLPVSPTVRQAEAEPIILAFADAPNAPSLQRTMGVSNDPRNSLRSIRRSLLASHREEELHAEGEYDATIPFPTTQVDSYFATIRSATQFGDATDEIETALDILANNIVERTSSRTRVAA